jgi:hypothetical protein
MTSQRVMSPTIRVELIGGLGNQMFQAAAGRAVAERIGGRLELDITRIGGSRQRRFALDALPHGATVIRDERNVISRKVEKLTHAAARAIDPTRRRPVNGWTGPVYVEPHFHFDPSLLSITGSCYLRGYFQSPLYFADVSDLIRRSFNLRGSASAAAIKAADNFAPADVAVHIRRGDFAADSLANRVHGVLDASYYNVALQFMESQGAVGVIHAFSDDHEYARTVLARDDRVVFHRGETEHDDMFMMSQARRHIIANSTFSWWSAWLDPRPNSLAVAPTAWFSEEKRAATNLANLFPENWKLI